MVAASEDRGSRRIKDGRAQHSRQLVLDLQLAILGLRRVICCLIEALVDYLGTGQGFVRGYHTPHAAIPLLKTLVAGVLFHSCILGASHLVILISLIWTAPNGPYPFCSFASSVCVTLITPSSGLNKLLPLNQRHLVLMLPPLPLAGDVTDT